MSLPNREWLVASSHEVGSRMTRPRRYGFLKLLLNNQSGKWSRFYCCEAIVDGLFVVEKQALDNIWEGCCFILVCVTAENTRREGLSFLELMFHMRAKQNPPKGEFQWVWRYFCRDCDATFRPIQTNTALRGPSPSPFTFARGPSRERTDASALPESVSHEVCHLRKMVGEEMIVRFVNQL